MKNKLTKKELKYILKLMDARFAELTKKIVLTYDESVEWIDLYDLSAKVTNLIVTKK